MPKHIEPMLATLATKAFDDDDWLFEIKWDGFRVQAVVDDGKVRIWTRSLKDAEMYFPNLLSPPRWIEAQQAIVDGEVVALDEAGRPDFSLLQTKLGEQDAASGLVYQPFDLLYLDGRSLLQVPLEDRKRLLRSVLKEHPRVRYAAHVERRGQGVLRGGRGERARGHHRQAPPLDATSRASARRPGSRSRSGRSRSWWSVAGPRGAATPRTSAPWQWACTRAASCGSRGRWGAASRPGSGATYWTA